ncbi:MAG TPA: orotate phosphoribosyltransferase [Polyangiales bacterium]|jgi:orotate phosphoribosyltransferase|nr:orotate phosphoribosyltransferase [Polyangiales bacterium]
MQDYKRELIEFMVRCDVLTFGDFTAKSGRKTPYFVNTGRYRTGAQLSQLARFYAAAITREMGREFDVLFGPAYKGIPLAAATAVALAEQHGHDVGFCFNRKEAKDHGEGGVLVGHPLRDGDRVLIIEDVTTAGSSIRETVPILRAAANVKLAGLVVSVDRMEKGTGEKNALAEIRDTYGMKTFSIVNIEEIVEHLSAHEVDGKRVLTPELLTRLAAYRKQYGGSQ